MPYLPEWSIVPDRCRACRERRAAQWYEVRCQDCGAAIRAHRDWSNPPRRCPSCKARNAASWYDIRCQDCGTTVRAHRDWSHPPKRCASCKARNDAQWYEARCSDCGVTIRINRAWTNPPRRCQSCKARNDAKWFDIVCRLCGTRFQANRDWSHVPEVCKSCKASLPSRNVSCSHCGKSFEIKSGTRIKCRINGWVEPKRCTSCKELFKHQPFTTRREETPLGVVFKTYNARGQLVRESREEHAFLFGKRMKHSKGGKTHAYSYQRDGVFHRYTEITDPSGKKIKHLDK